MAGRPPKLQNQKTGAYTKENKKAQLDSLPVYKTQEFIPPLELTKKELEVWEYISDIFRQTRNCMVTDADLHMMYMYCRDKVMMDEATQRYRKNATYWMPVQHGFEKNGEPKYLLKVNPDYCIMKDKTQSCLKLIDQLGLSPLARARAGVKGANAQMEKKMFEKIMGREDEE